MGLWDHKEHDNDIQVDPEYEGCPSYIANTDVTLIDQKATIDTQHSKVVGEKYDLSTHTTRRV